MVVVSKGRAVVFDPRTVKDWQIAEAAEEKMKPIVRLAG